MKAKLLLFVLLVLSRKMTQGIQTSLNVGRKHPTDDLIERAEEKGRGSPDYSLSFSKTYVGDNYQIITELSVKDLIDNGGAYSAIAAGGPGHTFVTLTYTILRRADFNYEILIYGKPPIFNKIP